MANSNTAHSKALRAATAAAYNRRQIESGAIKILNVRLKKEVYEQFDAVAKELGLSRPETIRHLLALYAKQS